MKMLMLTTLTGTLVALGSNTPDYEAAVVAIGHTVVCVLIEVMVPKHLLQNK